jgi:predicted nucleic acid-binding protein
MILLDTSFCIDWLRENTRCIEGDAGRKLKSLGSLPLAVSLFTLCELEAGAQGSRSPESELRKVRRFIDHVTLVVPGRGFPALYGEVFQGLKREGIRIPLMDLLIGLCAKQESLPVLTRDIDHFSRILGLTVESW